MLEGTVLFVHKKNQKTDTASESNANIVCKLPSSEEEGEAKLQSASLRDALAVSARLVGLDFPVWRAWVLALLLARLA